MDSEETGIGGVGPIVKVTWNDAAQNIKVHCIDGANPENHLAKCQTIGELIASKMSDHRRTNCSK